MNGIAFDLRALRASAVQGVPEFWRHEPEVAWSFDTGRPDPATFPIDDFVRLSEVVLRANTDAAVQYGEGFDGMMYGFSGLRDLLAERAGREDGRDLDRRSVILTSGSVHAISLALKAFIDPGDVVAVEAPTWGVVISTARRRGAEVTAVPVDAEGLQVDLLVDELRRLDRAGKSLKLLYVISDFNTPSGVTLSLDRRRRLVDLAAEHRFLILEDNVYRDLRYTETSLPTLYSLDRSGLVFKVESFSKTIAPSLRLGWATGHPDVIAAIASVRSDLGVSQLTSRLVAEYLGQGLFNAHLSEIKTLYGQKLAAAESCLHQHCDPWVSWRTPEGGFFLWVGLEPSVDGVLLAEKALERGVLIRSGERFFGEGERDGQRFRLSFSRPGLSSIQRGIAELGQAMQDSVRPHARS